MTNNAPTNSVGGIVSRIKPCDEIEEAHIDDILRWARSNAPLYRIAKPDIPPKHLVSYFVLYDEARDKILLIDHAKALAWLPTGGHVDLGEDPRETVKREAIEELGISADFGTRFGQDPLFATLVTTRGYGEHTDVCLWYIVGGDSSQELKYDPREMHGYAWLSPEEIMAKPISDLDPHMHRFVRKMRKSNLDEKRPST